MVKQFLGFVIRQILARSTASQDKALIEIAF